MSTVFENRTKSLIQHCELSELRLHFKWTLDVNKSDLLQGATIAAEVDRISHPTYCSIMTEIFP